MQNRLRVYYGPPAEVVTETVASPTANEVSVPLAELLPLLADAFMSKRTWLRDFESEAVTISTDLYEVVMAYQHHRRPSA